MNKIKKQWSNIFGISSTEFSGFRLLFFTATICCLGLALVNHLSKEPYDNIEKDVRILDSLLAIMATDDQLESIKINEIIYVEFDPNTVSDSVLLQIGFPKWLVTRLINYRKTGARFNNPKDLMKLYDFPDTLYLKIAEYVKIDQLHRPRSYQKKPSPNTKPKESFKTTPLPIFDLNNADTAVLQTINGIGSKLSIRIISYRASLGGFIKKEQLFQVYGLDTVVVKRLLLKSLIMDDFIPSKIDINAFNKDQLASHPYISWNQAKLIIAYRNQHGDFEGRQDLLEVYTINEEWIKKIAPYLTF